MELKTRFQNIYADEDYILKIRAWYLFLFNLASVFMNSVALAMFLYKNVQFLPASFLIFFFTSILSIIFALEWIVPLRFNGNIYFGNFDDPGRFVPWKSEWKPAACVSSGRNPVFAVHKNPDHDLRLDCISARNARLLLDSGSKWNVGSQFCDRFRSDLCFIYDHRIADRSDFKRVYRGKKRAHQRNPSSS